MGGKNFQQQAKKSRRSTEEALRESHASLLAILDSMDAVVYVADIDTHELIFVNKYIRDMFGDIVGRKCWEVLQEGQSGPCPFCTNHELIRPNGTIGKVLNWEFRNTRTGRWYEIRDRAIKWIDGRVVRLEIALDITERKKHEEERVRLNSLEAVGRLAAGVAHQMINPLAAASVNAQVLRILLPGDDTYDSASRKLDLIEQGISKAAGIAKELLHLSNQGDYEFIPTNVNEVISGALTLLEFRLEGITLERRLSDIPFIEGNPDRLEQVFVNILDNALDAMPDGGTILVSTARDQGQVVIEIADSGRGVPDDVLPKVFEPFFSTKGEGGTGLGLSVCYGLVKQHGGTIGIASHAGEGATVTIRLPAIKDTDCEEVTHS